jgi:hypothetical protein
MTNKTWWAQLEEMEVGTQVVVTTQKYRSYGHDQKGTVTKVTKTQFTVEMEGRGFGDGSSYRFSKSTGNALGQKTGSPDFETPVSIATNGGELETWEQLQATIDRQKEAKDVLRLSTKVERLIGEKARWMSRTKLEMILEVIEMED